MVKPFIIETGIRCVVASGCKIKSIETRPVDCGKAHRAGLATRINFTAGKVECAQLGAGVADGHDLGMCGWIVGRGDAVPALSDNLIIFCNDGTEWASFISIHFCHREGDCLVQKSLVHSLMLLIRVPIIKLMHSIDQSLLDEAVSAIRAKWPFARPRMGIILGSGWGDAVSGFRKKDEMSYEDIPNLGSASAPGHAGKLLLVERDGSEILVFKGRVHCYEGSAWGSIVLPVWVIKQMGARILLLTNAAGGIRKDLEPGSLVVMEDHINLLGGNPLTGPHNPAFGDRFPDQSAIYDFSQWQSLLEAGADASGVYIAVEGPTFETPAEIRAYGVLGADMVGMSTVPEAIFANAIGGLIVSGLSCICNWAAGMHQGTLSSEDVIRTAKETMPKMRALIENFVDDVLL